MYKITKIQNSSFFNWPYVCFHITFKCLKDIQETIEWKLIYIGSAKDETHDQTIDSFEMNNLAAGVMQFTVESNPPDFTKIPKDDLLGNKRS